MADSYEARLGAGNVEFELDGEKKTLKMTVRAVLGVSQLAGGLIPVSRRVAELDVPTIVAVIALGLDLTPLGAKDLEAKVILTGLGYGGVVEPVTRFLENMANGGRPAREVAEENPREAPESA